MKRPPLAGGAQGDWRHVVTRAAPVRGDDWRIAEWVSACLDRRFTYANEALLRRPRVDPGHP